MIGGRWGGRASGQAGTRDFRRIGSDENMTEARHRTENRSFFNGKQGERRPPHSMPEAASGMSESEPRGYDGSRFELRYIANEAQPWHVVDSDAGDDPEKGPEDKVKKFNTQEEAEKYILECNTKAYEDDSDTREELHYRKHPVADAQKFSKEQLRMAEELVKKAEEAHARAPEGMQRAARRKELEKERAWLEKVRKNQE